MGWMIGRTAALSNPEAARRKAIEKLRSLAELDDPEGVVVTDPISPDTAKVYLAEIRKITQAPIRYVVSSHHHYAHISGGGATWLNSPGSRRPRCRWCSTTAATTT